MFKQIGGMFCIEEPEKPGFPGGSFLSRLGGEDSRFCMSGRCALYFCLEDLKLEKKFASQGGRGRPLAYLPAYTCETVVAPYKKAGYELCFYDIEKNRLVPRFNREMIPRISVLALCGYFGFSYYDRDFVQECKDAGVAIVHDITHSAFSEDGIEEMADYTAGSLRKWLGIPSGGLAVKRRGRFQAELLPPEEEHIQGRLACFEERRKVLAGSDAASDEQVEKIFWETELRLRRMFDRYESDSRSIEIIRGFPWEKMVQRRRENYAFILDQNLFGPGVQPVFPELPAGGCPSHLSLYSPNRDAAQDFLARRGIGSTFYWPFPGEGNIADYPGAAYICDHIYSVPIDQRYSLEDMKTLCTALQALGEVSEQL